MRDSITGRSQAAREARAAKAERAKRRRQQLEDEEEAGAPQRLGSTNDYTPADLS